MKIGIGLKMGSYTPEAYAYASYLEGNGFHVQLEKEDYLDPDLDLHIFFCGIRTKYKESKGPIEIHEYSSLSTPPFAIQKNFLKRYINKIPEGRIFLNDIVKNEIGFLDEVPYILRDMGVDDEFFSVASSSLEYDLLYCGSLVGRLGLAEQLKRLAAMGLKILVVGEVSKFFMKEFMGNTQIKFTGRLKRNELPAVFGLARAGLNYTPNIYPFNIQTSTKTLEYCAAGLGVVSNSYEWANFFEKSRSSKFLWLENIRSKDDFDTFNFEKINVSDLNWSKLLEKANLVNFIMIIFYFATFLNVAVHIAVYSLDERLS